MKIGYYLHWDLSRESGVLKKVMAQIRSWQNLGANVQLFAISHQLPICPELAEFSITVLPNGSYLTRNHQVFKLTKKILDWKPDIVYTRFATYYPALEILMKKIPVVMEVNTDDRAENRLAHSGMRNLYHSITRTRLLSGARGLVFVTHELAQRFAWAGPQTVIANGISLADYPELPAPQNESPHLVFMGHPGIARDLTANWHGLDRLLQLASTFPTWQFDVIGPSVQEMGTVPPNVHLQGYLGSAAYTPLLARSDIGIGTLALERKGMREACPLKVREYLASGLPVITAYQDTDFPDGAPFLLNLPLASSDLSAHLGEIQAFVQHWSGARIPRPAIAHLDSTQKETLRLEFLAQFKNH